jgi:hypothetical protein
LQKGFCLNNWSEPLYPVRRQKLTQNKSATREYPLIALNYY